PEPGGARGAGGGGRRGRLGQPLSGEGIGHAMESGELAAIVVAEALRSGHPSLAMRYPALLRERFGRGLGAGRRAVRFLARDGIARPTARVAMAFEPLARVGIRAMLDVDARDGRPVGARVARTLLTLGSLGLRPPSA